MKTCNDVPSYSVGEASRANPKGLARLPNIYNSERYQKLPLLHARRLEFAAPEMRYHMVRSAKRAQGSDGHFMETCYEDMAFTNGLEMAF